MSPEGERLLAIFAATARDYLRAAIGIASTTMIGEPMTGDGSLSTHTVLIRARGGVSAISWSFPRAIVERAAHRMVPELELDDEVRGQAASELANVLTGRAVAALAEHGVATDIEPPVLAPAELDGSVAQLVSPLGAISVVLHGMRRAG